MHLLQISAVGSRPCLWFDCILHIRIIKARASTKQAIPNKLFRKRGYFLKIDAKKT